MVITRREASAPALQKVAARSAPAAVQMDTSRAALRGMSFAQGEASLRPDAVQMKPAAAAVQKEEPAAEAPAATDAPAAEAEPASGGGGGDLQGGYGYEFADDPLSAGGFGPDDATIRVRPGPVRATRLPEPAGLEGKFKVILPELGEKKLAPNFVTPEEYAEIVALYNSVKNGSGDLVIATDGLDAETAERYRTAILDNLGSILQTDTGRAQLRTLIHNVKTVKGKKVHRKTTIRAGEDKDHDGDRTNDFAARTDPANSADSVRLESDTEERPGSDSTVEFNPGSGAAAGARDDVALMHELMHALTQTKGVEDVSSVAPADGIRADAAGPRPVARFEHQAVGIGKYKGSKVSENRYRSERNQIGANGTGALDGDASMPQRDAYRQNHGH